jgi:L-aminoadipate-semialdehyde dehydrogenase
MTEEQVKFWKDTFAVAQSIKFPSDFPRTIFDQDGEKVVPVEYTWSSEETIPNLKARFSSAFKNGDETTFVLALYGVLLARYTAEENFLVGFSDKGTETLVQFTSNSGEPASKQNLFSAFYERLTTFIHDDYKRRQASNNTPIQTILEQVFKDTDPKKTPLEQYEQFVQTSFDAANTQDKPFKLTNVEAHLRFNAETGSIRAYYQKNLISEARIMEALRQIVLLADQVLANPEVSIYDYSLVTPGAFKVIPDPLEQLSKEWFGPVYSYLEKVAAADPERIAVVDAHETVTYGTLNGMANRLARELIDMGIERQNIVAIFGHRSIPIVLAIAAVLKAGAAYTIIDPAYPPQRIIDCLQVATPAAIINIEANGKLPTEVRQFLKSDHEKNTVRFTYTVKSIKETIQNESLDHQSPENLTDVEIGPNDIAVLTFTSGSTGIPKGVLGRHGPLTHYYPWMKKTFNFTENEVYSMQSGIAHDPLQRDIFTPWFLGARLYVPHPDDIVNPGRLSQWFREKKITVTHLTPAMGQLLTTSAAEDSEGKGQSLLPDLRYAFFVGDVLTKKFVRRMCSYCPKVIVINIYGSTETQRSVSYYPVPRPKSETNPDNTFEYLKDILPAGKGMQDLQALVVSRFTSDGKFKMAGIGELGEIFMRSPHIARGYKDKPEDTAQKFVVNPFTDNADPEDRMYRTGDIGRYLPSGDVECLGRADDQIKIRGFRIELGEINTALNSHDLVKESVTIVRTDTTPNPEEKRIVAYVVFDVTNSDVAAANASAQPTANDDSKVIQFHHFSNLVRILRKYLRSKLPDYMIPSNIVALAKLPLNPNGKIKKEALPKPEADQPDEDFAAPRSELETELSKIWCEVLGVSSLGIHDNFFDVGGNSLSASSLTFKIRQGVTGASSLPVEVLYRAPTIGAMAVAIERIRSGKKSPESAGKVIDLSQDTILDADIIPEALTSKQVEEGSFEFKQSWTAPKAIFLTGCTGFLGAFLLSDLIKHTTAKIYCLVRVNMHEKPMDRVMHSLLSHKLVWNPDSKAPSLHDTFVDMKKFEKMIEDRVQPVVGDLSKPLLGMSEEKFAELSNLLDLIVHNGAVVHWMYPYEKLKAANVLGTQEILRLACRGKKLTPVHYISTTSVFDSDQYSNLTDVFEDSTLPYHEDLRGGYPQSKFVAERLVMAARKRGLPAAIYRCGYVTGHSQTGVWNPDDYLCRMIKGCIQMGVFPDFPTTKLDLSPVDFVSRAIVYLILHKESLTKHKAYHLVNPNEFFFNDLFQTAVRLGYKIKPVDVEVWKKALFDSVAQKAADDEDRNALYPMLTYFSDDFGARMRTAKRPWYDNTNTLDGLKNSGITCPSVLELMTTYYRFLCQCQFLPPPATPTPLAIKLGFDLIQPISRPEQGSFVEGEEERKLRRSNSQSSIKSSDSNSSLSSYKDLMRTNRS